MTTPIFTRVGTIVDGDNRYFGRSVFAEWSQQTNSASDVLLLALGLPAITDQGREVLRLIALCATSPDARVWPLKLTRLLASRGDPLAGYFGAQLITAGKLMGPGAAVEAARGLAWILAELDDDADDADLAVATRAWCARRGNRFGGFGVPFRDVDERRAGLLRIVGDGPIARGRHWQLHERVVAAMRPQQPNCVISFAAMLLDIGVAPERAGIAVSVCMAHTFLAHAIEAAVLDGATAHDLPRAAIDYRGVPPRHSRDATPQNLDTGDSDHSPGAAPSSPAPADS